MKGLDLQQNDLAELKKIWDSWGSAKSERFREKYGHIGYLIGIEPDKDMIRAMVQFWDPSYRCFTFHEVDMTPTIEEYMVLLNLKLKDPDKIYQPQSGYRKKLALMLGIHSDNLDGLIHKKGDLEGVKKNFLLDFIRQNQENDRGLQAMALAIYGLVIFPHTHGYISGGVINMVDRLEYEVNPVPVILAETFRSLNACRRNGGGRFQGCIQLFHIWAKSHFTCLQSRFKPVSHINRIPLQEFKLSIWERNMSKEEWISRLQNLISS